MATVSPDAEVMRPRSRFVTDMACMLGETLYNEGQDKQRIGSRLVQGSWDISG